MSVVFLFKRKHLNKMLFKADFRVIIMATFLICQIVYCMVPGLIQCFTQGWKNRYKSCNVSESKQSSAFCSHPNTWCLSPYHSLILWPHCSLTASPTVLLTMCTVSHPLPPHAYPALTIQSTAPPLLLTLLWFPFICSCPWYRYYSCNWHATSLCVENLLRVANSATIFVCNVSVSLSFIKYGGLQIYLYECIAFRECSRKHGTLLANKWRVENQSGLTHKCWVSPPPP